MRKQLALAVSVAVAGVLTWSGSPGLGAAPGWTAPQPLSVTGNASDPEVALAADGRAVVVWEQEGSRGSRVVSAQRGVSGVWSSPRPLCPSGDRPATGQQVAMNDHGFAVVTWERAGKILVAVRSADGTWSAQRQVSSGGGGSFPQVAVTDAGRVYVVWEQTHGVSERVEVVRRATDGTWTQPVVLPSGFGNGLSPQVAVDALGHATVVWQRMWGDGGRTAVLASRLSGGRWSATRTLSAAGRNSGEPLVVMNDRGLTVVAWGGRQSGRVVVLGVVRPSAGPWGAVHTVVRGSLSDLALGRTGQALAAWTRHVNGEVRIGLSRRFPSLPWQQGRLLPWTADMETTAPRLAMGGGTDTLAWSMTGAVHAVRQDGGGPWDTPTALGGSGVSYYQQVAMDSVGRAVVVWKEWDGVHDVVMMSSSSRD